MVPHVGAALWQRPEQTRENLPPWELPGRWVEGLTVWGFLPLPWLLGPWEWAGAAGDGAGSSRAWMSFLKQHHPRTWLFHELPEKI